MELIGDIPGVGQIMLRESPELASAGQTSVQPATPAAGGGEQWTVDSFFDVFTELSVDGGNTWIASTDSVRMELVQPVLIDTVGPAEVHVFFEGATEGVAYDDDNNNLDEVETELVSMDLRGSSPLGPVSVTLREDVASRGEISERINEVRGLLEVAPFDAAGVSADSFFDVWPEIHDRRASAAHGGALAAADADRPQAAGRRRAVCEPVPAPGGTDRPGHRPGHGDLRGTRNSPARSDDRARHVRADAGVDRSGTADGPGGERLVERSQCGGRVLRRSERRRRDRRRLQRPGRSDDADEGVAVERPSRGTGRGLRAFERGRSDAGPDRRTGQPAGRPAGSAAVFGDRPGGQLLRRVLRDRGASVGSGAAQPRTGSDGEHHHAQAAGRG